MILLRERGTRPCRRVNRSRDEQEDFTRMLPAPSAPAATGPAAPAFASRPVGRIGIAT